MTTTKTDTPSHKIQAIRALTAAGYILVPLCPLEAPHNHKGKPCRTPGKVPVARDWTSVQLGDYSEEELARGNYGVVLQKDDLVVDADPRNFKAGDDPVARLIKKIGAELHTFTVQSGSGGWHWYFKKPVDVDVVSELKDFQGIDFKSRGGQMVGPGSGHVSGGEYRAVSGLNYIKPADAPTQLLALLSKTNLGDGAPGIAAGAFVDDAETRGRYLAYLQDTAKPSVQGQRGDANAFKVACHGRDLGLSPEAAFTMMYEVWNPKCAPPWDADELRAKVDHAYKYAKSALGNEQPSVDFKAVELPADEKKAASKPDFRTDSNGRLIKSFHNLLQYFKHGPTGLIGVFAYNDFTQRVEFARPAPWHGAKMPRQKGVADNDLKLLKAHLAVNWKFEMALAQMEEAVTVVAMDNRFHPVREYLESLTWDKKPRLDTWISTYLGAEDTPYTRACARKTLCGAVMRIMRPGIQFDHVLVLEGRQGIGKSSAIRALAGEHGSDAPIDPHHRDTIHQMQGRWIIEIAEFYSYKKADNDALKAFVTRPKDEARLAYHRTVVEFPRQSIFIGTINPGADGTYLKDDENRRWWPVLCGDKAFDIKGLKSARNQLFAEAMERVRAGEALYMDTPELREAAKREAERRRSEHPWAERIAHWLREVQSKVETRRDFITTRDIFVGAIGGSDKQLDRLSANAIADVLRNLGYEAAKSGTTRGWALRCQEVVFVDPLSDDAVDVLGDLA